MSKQKHPKGTSVARRKQKISDRHASAQTSANAQDKRTIVTPIGNDVQSAQQLEKDPLQDGQMIKHLKMCKGETKGSAHFEEYNPAEGRELLQGAIDGLIPEEEVAQRLWANQEALNRFTEALIRQSERASEKLSVINRLLKVGDMREEIVLEAGDIADEIRHLLSQAEPSEEQFNSLIGEAVSHGRGVQSSYHVRVCPKPGSKVVITVRRGMAGLFAITAAVASIFTPVANLSSAAQSAREATQFVSTMMQSQEEQKEAGDGEGPDSLRPGQTYKVGTDCVAGKYRIMSGYADRDKPVSYTLNGKSIPLKDGEGIVTLKDKDEISLEEPCTAQRIKEDAEW